MNCFFKYRMDEFSCDFIQWFKYEAAILNLGMGHNQVKVVDDFIIKEENIDINHPWFILFLPRSSHFFFNLKNDANQFNSGEIGLYKQDLVKKILLILFSPGRGFIHRRLQ